MRLLLLPLLPLFLGLNACSSLPKPGSLSGQPGAETWLRQSAISIGDPVREKRTVVATFDGEWSDTATRLQPILTDPAFRERSVEIFDTTTDTVDQQFFGAGGRKVVIRDRRAGTVTVKYNDRESSDPSQLAAAALVADAYAIFTMGAAELERRGKNWSVAGDGVIEGSPCILLQGTLRPGLGNAAEDAVIAWIDKESKALRRVQLTLNGLPSTQGADIEVTFSKFKARPDGLGTVPLFFEERVVRPIPSLAHTWRRFL